MVDALSLLRELVRIPSVTPDAEGEAAVAEVLRGHLDAAGLDTIVLRSPDGRPSLLARLPGPADRPALVLCSHTDVVPVEPDAWTRDPFGADVADGFVWGRGTLDMKGVAVMHAGALVRLARSAADVQREVVLVAVADEEAGGGQGAQWLVADHGDRVGFHPDRPPPDVLGEGGFGLAGLLPRPVMPVVVGEKAPLGVHVRATGTPGHGSLPPDEQAIRILARFLEKVSGPGPARLHPVVREQLQVMADATDGPTGRVLRMLAGPAGPAAVRALAPVLRSRLGALGHVLADSITPTRLQAGYAHNVVPGTAEAALDCRLLPDTDPDAVLAGLRRAGRHVSVEEVHRWSSPVSEHGPALDTLAAVSATLPGDPLPVPALTPGTTDLRFFRARGARAYGWVPVTLAPEVLATFHGHDERLPLDQLDTAVDAMAEAVARLAT